MDNFGFLKVAAAIPHLRVGDCTYNTERMAALAEEAARRGVEIVVFPELGTTAYTCGDLVLQPTLLDAADEALARLARDTRKLPLVLIAGAPLRHGASLYNCAVVMTQGKILGVVPKSYIPDYGEFYEGRWFASGAGISEERIDVAGQQADFGADLTFAVNGAEFGVEICEDLWAPIPPSSQLALNGAKVIFNLSASPELAGKHDYLRQLVAQQSARTLSAYVYASAGLGESSTDLVFAGNGLIAENGTILREAERFSTDEQIVVADVDIQRLEFERRRNTSFRQRESSSENTVIEMEIPEGLRAAVPERDIDPMPFVPKEEGDRQVFAVDPPVGASSECYCSAVGKCLLAFSQDIDLGVYERHPMKAHTEHTITTLSVLRSELAKVRERGYAMDHEELEYGLACIGAPILSRSGEAVAARPATTSERI